MYVVVVVVIYQQGSNSKLENFYCCVSLVEKSGSTMDHLVWYLQVEGSNFYRNWFFSPGPIRDETSETLLMDCYLQVSGTIVRSVFEGAGLVPSFFYLIYLK